jgi:hypothetical protein
MFFVTDYKKVKLINNSIINNITNKESFLHELIDDKKYLHNDTDKELKDLKQITINLTKGLSDGQKISKIYGYIL